MERKYDEAKKPECPQLTEENGGEIVELLTSPIYRYFGWYPPIKNEADATKVANFIVKHMQHEGYVIIKKYE